MKDRIRIKINECFIIIEYKFRIIFQIKHLIDEKYDELRTKYRTIRNTKFLDLIYLRILVSSDLKFLRNKILKCVIFFINNRQFST